MKWSFSVGCHTNSFWRRVLPSLSSESLVFFLLCHSQGSWPACCLCRLVLTVLVGAHVQPQASLISLSLTIPRSRAALSMAECLPLAPTVLVSSCLQPSFSYVTHWTVGQGSPQCWIAPTVSVCASLLLLQDSQDSWTGKPKVFCYFHSVGLLLPVLSCVTHLAEGQPSWFGLHQPPARILLCHHRVSVGLCLLRWSVLRPAFCPFASQAAGQVVLTSAYAS